MSNLDSPYLVEGAVMMHLNFVNMDYNTLHYISDQWYSNHSAIMVDLKCNTFSLFISNF